MAASARDETGPVEGAVELRDEILAVPTLNELLTVLVTRKSKVPGQKGDAWPPKLLQAVKLALIERLRRFTWNFADHTRQIEEAAAQERAAAAGIQRQPARQGRGAGGEDQNEIPPEEDLEGFSAEFANANLVALLRIQERHGAEVIDEEVVAQVFRTPTFGLVPPFFHHALRLLESALSRTELAKDRKDSGALRDAASRWIRAHANREPAIYIMARERQEEMAQEKLMAAAGMPPLSAEQRQRRQLNYHRRTTRAMLDFWKRNSRDIMASVAAAAKGDKWYVKIAPVITEEVLPWLIRVHFDSHLFSGDAVDSIRVTDYVAGLISHDQIPPLVTEAWVDSAVRSILRGSLGRSEVVDSVFPRQATRGRDHDFSRAGRALLQIPARPQNRVYLLDRLSGWQADSIRRLLEAGAVAMNDSTIVVDRKNPDNVDPGIFLRRSQKKRDLPALLRVDAPTVSLMLCYAIVHGADGIFDDFVGSVADAFRQAAVSVAESTATASFINACRQALCHPWGDFLRAWMLLERADSQNAMRKPKCKDALEPIACSAQVSAAVQNISDRFDELQIHHQRLEALTSLANHFFVDTDVEVNQSLKSVESRWNNLSVLQVRAYLTSAEQGNDLGKAALDALDADKQAAAPVPGVFLSASNWLKALEKSKLFNLLWTTEVKKHSPDGLNAACEIFTKLRQELDEGTVSFKRLEQLKNHLVDEVEVSLLYRTTRDISENGGNFVVHTGASAEANIRHSAEDLLKRLQQFQHLSAVRSNIKNMDRVLQALSNWVEARGQESVASLREIVAGLKKRLDASKWDTLTLSDVRSFWREAAAINEALTRHQPELWELVSTSKELLLWLRTRTPDDGNFTSSLEMAMGRGEMECPVELWVPADGKEGGRVDEEKLSQLRSVRAYLHPLIFRDQDLLKSVNEAVTILGQLSTTTDVSNIITSLKSCNEFLEPLSRLLADDSDGAAPDRLVHLMDPARGATWHCDDVDGVSLRWSVTLSGQTREQRQSASELLDFQSSVVLAKSDQRTVETQAAIDQFVGQFAWLRELLQHFEALSAAGHFGYRTFNVTYAMTVEANEIRDAARAASQELEKWTAAVEAARSKYYFLNFYSMKEAWVLYDELVKVPRNAGEDGVDIVIPPALATQLDKALRTINPIAADTEEIASRVRLDLLGSWVGGELPHAEGRVTCAVAEALITKVGQALQLSLRQVPPRIRQVPVPVEVAADFDALVGNQVAEVEVAAPVADAAAAAPAQDAAADADANNNAAAPENAAADAPAAAEPAPATTAAEEVLKRKSAAVAGLHETGVQLVVAEGRSRVVHHVLSAYARGGRLPERELCLVCKPDTTFLDVQNLLYRWAGARSQDASDENSDRSKSLYTLAAIENLDFSAQRRTVQMIRRCIAASAATGALNPLLVVSGEAEQQHMVAQLSPFRVADARALDDDLLQKVSDHLAKNYVRGVSAHQADHAGAGKSFAIREIATTSMLRYVHVPVMRGADLIERMLDSINRSYVNDEVAQADPYAAAADARLLLHIDMMDTITTATNSLLFDLIYLGSVVDPSTGYSFFWNAADYVAVEVASGMGANSSINRCPIANTLPQIRAKVSPDTFCSDEDGLMSGMGYHDFMSSRYDGTARRKILAGKTTANAFRRLQYVCMGLDVMDKQGGRFPYVFESPANEDDPSAALSSSIEHLSRSMAAGKDGKDSKDGKQVDKSDTINMSQTMVINAGNAIPGDRCFKLLIAASESDPERTSLLCLWNFVNVLYWQLRDMHFSNSPLNNACMPDEKATRKDDAEQKAKIKGDMIYFMMSTAREFAMRQVNKVDREVVIGAKMSGNTRWAFNGFWERQLFENDKNPVYKLRQFYMYFRAAKQHWVIDDIVEYSGAVFSCSDTADLHGRWTTSPDWVVSKTMKVAKISDRKAFEGEAYEVSGLTDKEAEDNGKYLRLPAYDDIGNKPHYLKEGDGTSKNPRRHMFWSATENVWQICPVCTPEEGAFALSQTQNPTGQWRRMPPDIIEKNLKIEIVSARDEERNLSRGGASARTAMGARRRRVGGDGAADGEAEPAESEEQARRRAILGADSELFDTLKKWNDSNHECILFNNNTYTVTFMSMDPKTMRDRMHPNLLKHLELNNIKVGENLDQLTDRHHTLLSALTEKVRTKEEADSLLGGGYCLTGDNLVKMLAIFARVRCGVPVVLLGECGCGKTQLLKYLCAWLEVPLCVLDVHGGTTESDILGIFQEAEAKLDANPDMRELFVFLDEINTCAHMGLLTEVICKRSLYGRRVHDKIHVLAALNPYRLRKERVNSGLVLQSTPNKTTNAGGHGGETGPILDPMAQLVYRVHPIPRTLQDFIFDFGSLPPDHELLYINSMVKGELQTVTDGDQHVIDFLSNLIHASQQYVRKVEGDPSATSLRDVRQCINLMKWFAKHVVSTNPPKKETSTTAKPTTAANTAAPKERTLKPTVAEPTPKKEEKKGGIRSWFSRKTRSKSPEPEPRTDSSATASKPDKAEKGKKDDKKPATAADRPEDREAQEKAQRRRAMMPAALLGLSFQYFYRLPSTEERTGYWDALSHQKIEWNMRHLQEWNVERFAKEGVLANTLQTIQRGFCQKFDLPEGIALNQALQENLFVVTISILNRIPIFVVGKPGSSKTLTLQIIGSNLQGQQSSVEFWRRFPAVYTFPYQCSPLSDSISIQHQFDMAVRYQKHADDCITVLLLDEVGLAELSPDMPLKVLHAMLVNPPIAIVGLSNWVLDPAKMNRAICLQRPDPTAADILLTGERIMDDKVTSGNSSAAPTTAASGDSDDVRLFESSSGKAEAKPTKKGDDARATASNWAQKELARFLGPLATAYHAVYINQKGRDWVGMRDYYCLIKQLRTMLISLHEKNGTLDNKVLTFALCRNFGGKPETMADILDGFRKELFSGQGAKQYRPKVTALIKANLQDIASRHLLVLTRNGAALPLLFGTGLLDINTTPVLIGSEFRDDRSELHLVQQINAIKRAMAAGSTVVLVNHDDIYEALYDVLNQRFLFKTDDSGQTHKMLRLAIGSRSQLCPVKDGFKLVVLVEAQHAYEDLDLPLLNRFEKQCLVASDVLGKNQAVIVKEVTAWCDQILIESGVRSYQDAFCGFHEGSIPSAVLAATNFNDDLAEKNRVAIVAKIKRQLWQVSLPIAVMHSRLLQAQQRDDNKSTSTFDQEYFSHHSDFLAAVDRYVINAAKSDAGDEQDVAVVSCNVLLTHSPVSHLQQALESSTTLQQDQCTILQLGELTSERQLTNNVDTFLAGVNASGDQKDRLLILQCDPVVASQALTNHAMHLCAQLRGQAVHGKSGKAKLHIMFVMHLPPGIRARQRHFALDFQRPWRYVFIDDLRPENPSEPLGTVTMLRSSAFELLKTVDGSAAPRVDIHQWMLEHYQQALAACGLPTVDPRDMTRDDLTKLSFGTRISVFYALLTEDRHAAFRALFTKDVLRVLEKHSKPDDHNMHVHVRMVTTDFSTGSLRQSLVDALRSLVTQAMSHVLRHLDVDYSLVLGSSISVQDKKYSDARIRLWELMSLRVKMGDAVLGGRSDLAGLDREVANNGRFGPLVARFPFPTLVSQTLDHADTRKSLGTELILPHQIAQLAESVFGRDLVDAWASFGSVRSDGTILPSPDHVDYLHDYVATAAVPLPGLKFTVALQMFESVVRATWPNALSSPTSIHAAIWCNTDRLFRLGQFLASQALGADGIKVVFDTIVKCKPAASIPTEQLDDSAVMEKLVHDMMRLDSAVIHAVLCLLWSDFVAGLRELLYVVEHGMPAGVKTLKAVSWIHRVGVLRDDIDDCLLAISSAPTNVSTPTVKPLQTAWLRLMAARLLLQEVVLPPIVALLERSTRARIVERRVLREHDERVDRAWQQEHGYRAQQQRNRAAQAKVSSHRKKDDKDDDEVSSEVPKVHAAALAAREQVVKEAEARAVADAIEAGKKALLFASSLDTLFNFVAPNLASVELVGDDNSASNISFIDVDEPLQSRLDRLDARSPADFGALPTWTSVIANIQALNTSLLGAQTASSKASFNFSKASLVHCMSEWLAFERAPKNKRDSENPTTITLWKHSRKQISREKKKLTQALSDALRRFTQEILFGGQLGFLKFGRDSGVLPVVSSQLRDQFHASVNGTSDFSHSLFMRRTMLQCLLRDEHDHANVARFVPSTIEGALLLVQHLEDSLPSPGTAAEAKKAGALAATTVPLTADILALVLDDKQPLQRLLGKVDVLPFLNAIAVLHYRLRLYASDVAAREEGAGDNENEGAAPIHADLNKVLSAKSVVGEYARVFVLKVVRSLAAIDRVGSMTTAPAALYPWLDLCVDRKELAKRGGATAVAEMISSSLPDPFVWAAADWTGANMCAPPFNAQEAAVKALTSGPKAVTLGTASTAAERKKEAARMAQAVQKAQEAHDALIKEQSESYHALCGVVRACATSGSLVQPLEDWLKENGKTQGNAKLARIIIPAALFQTCVIESDNCSSSGLKNLEQCLQRWLKKAPGGSSFIEPAVITWLCEGAKHQPAALLDDSGKVTDAKAPSKSGAERAMLQVMLHTYMTALDDIPWLFQFASDPAQIADVTFMPSAPEDPFQTAVRASGYVGWYRCPNGHPYSVGNCTYPMEVSKCPSCGCEIGGRNHQAVGGVVRMENAAKEVEGKLGYCVENDEEACERMSELGTFSLRFFIHSMMYMATQSSVFASKGYRDRIRHMLNSHAARSKAGEKAKAADVAKISSTMSTAKQAVVIFKRMQSDWKQLRQRLEVGDAEMCMALHMLLRELRTTAGLKAPENRFVQITASRTPKEQQEIEEAFETVCTRLFKRDTLKDRITAASASLGESNRMAVLRNIIGDDLWPKIHELVQGTPSIDQHLWMLRSRVSFEHFVSIFSSNAKNARKFPLLAQFLTHEHKLPDIQYIADILGWHRVLFTSLRRRELAEGKGLARDEALTVTNKTILDSLPDEDKAEAYEIFERYCAGVNSALPKVELLYQCQRNPFTASDNTIDLSSISPGKGKLGGAAGGAVLMDASTPIYFSLPSVLMDAEENDSPCLVTIGLLNMLQQSHDELLQQFQALSTGVLGSSEVSKALTAGGDAPAKHDDDDDESDDDSDDSFDSDGDEELLDEAALLAQHERRRRRMQQQERPAAGAAAGGRAAAGGVRAARNNTGERPAVPPVSYVTPTSVVRKHLFQYNRERDFMPLLRVITTQHLMYGAGGGLDYVFGQLEQALARSVFTGIRPLNLQISHFSYFGDVKRVGTATRLGRVGQRVPQESLDHTVLDGIWAELDTQSGFSALMTLLEMVVNFLIQIGQDIQPDTSLQEFTLRVLRVPGKQWEAAAPPTLRSRVQLKHVASLYLFLDESANGSPLDDVLNAFRVELPSSLASEIRQKCAGNQLDVSVLSTVLYAFLREQCTRDSKSQDLELKEYLTYIEADHDLASMEWYEEHFPDSLQFKHAYELYQLLQAHSRGA